MSHQLTARTGVAQPDAAAADGISRALRCLRDGTLSVADFAAVCCLQGLVGHYDVGTGTTPVTFKTGFTAAQPELVLDVADYFVLVPLCIQVHLEDSAGTDNEVVAQASRGLVGPGTSTAITGRNANTGHAAPAGVTAYSAYSGNGTAPAAPVEFWRTGYAFADTTGQPHKCYTWSAKDYAPVVIKGPGTLAVYVGATTTAPAGYIKATAIVLPASLVY